jgi:G3E family GTPase
MESNVTNVILITGFLGSGKTTFLNRIIKSVPEDQKLMILMNEFGEVGLDGTLIEGDDFDMLEISRGSIFCVCVKTDFIKGLNEVARVIKPDVLLVESTGVANPTALKKDLSLSIFNDRFRLTDQICIIDAACFEEVYESFASVEKQIESSNLFVINKIDLVAKERIPFIKKLVRTHNSTAEFVETTFADIPTERFFGNPKNNNANDAGPGNPAPLSDEALEATIEKLLENPDADAVPPDRLMSAVYIWEGNDIGAFKALISQFPDKLIRSKGVLDCGEGPYLFNLVMTQHVVEKYSPVKDCTPLMNNIVFIGPPEVIAQLEDLSKAYPELVKKSVYDPMKPC